MSLLSVTLDPPGRTLDLPGSTRPGENGDSRVEGSGEQGGGW